MYTVVMVYGSYKAKDAHSYRGWVQDVGVHSTSHFYYSLIMVYLNCTLSSRHSPSGLNARLEFKIQINHSRL